jgi:hypothetical protein
VLRVRWRIYAKAEKWDARLEIATALTRITPDRRFGWGHPAFSLRNLNLTAEANDVLLSVVVKFERNLTSRIISGACATVLACTTQS